MPHVLVFGARNLGRVIAEHLMERGWTATGVARTQDTVDAFPGNGILAELIALAGGADHVMTVADVDGARHHGVRFSRGDEGRALGHAVGAAADRAGKAGGVRRTLRSAQPGWPGRPDRRRVGIERLIELRPG